jgi:hypothetical protein
MSRPRLSLTLLGSLWSTPGSLAQTLVVNECNGDVTTTDSDRLSRPAETALIL